MSPAAEQLAKCLLRVAIQSNENAVEGTHFTAYEWQTTTAMRVLLQLKDSRGLIFSESDVDADVVTGVYRVWVDGVEVGSPGLN